MAQWPPAQVGCGYRLTKGKNWGGMRELLGNPLQVQ